MSYTSGNIHLFECFGDVAKCRDWRRRVEVYHAGAPYDKRHLTAPKVLGYLRGDAYEGTRHFDPEGLREQGPDGLKTYLDFLDARCGWQQESLLYDATER